MVRDSACCVLMATREHTELLVEQSLPSICRQTCPPCLVLVVNDGKPFTEEEHQRIIRLLSPIPVLSLQNENCRGAAGAWNHGLRYLLSASFNGFVAFLDDDDDWDVDHLAVNLKAAHRGKANVVISGLRMVIDGYSVMRELITSVSHQQFLTGNPGWQGSNTFVHIDLLRSVGGFRNGLQSTNDRDLAIRILRHPDCRMAFTERWTSTWYLLTDGNQLSSRGSAAKLSGLRWFWHFYGGEMTTEEADHFFSRAAELFDFVKQDITEYGPDLPTHHRMHGDLDA